MDVAELVGLLACSRVVVFCGEVDAEERQRETTSVEILLELYLALVWPVLYISPSLVSSYEPLP